MWNSGFNSIITNVAQAGIQNQCESYAKNYIHNFLIDLYSAIRQVALNQAPDIAGQCYDAEIGRTGHKYDPFLRGLFNLMHPVLCNNALEESLVFINMNYDRTRQHNNWFNLADIAEHDLDMSRTFAIFDTLDRSKQVTMSSLQFGTTRGSGAALIDFYPRVGDKTHAFTWLNMDNNYNDNDLTLMYIVAQDLFEQRFGPRYVFNDQRTEGDRDDLEPPFYAEIIVNEDDPVPNAMRPYHVNQRGDEVESYADARTQAVEVVTMYSRTVFFYRKLVLQTINPLDRYNAFKQIVEG